MLTGWEVRGELYNCVGNVWRGGVFVALMHFTASVLPNVVENVNQGCGEVWACVNQAAGVGNVCVEGAFIS